MEMVIIRFGGETDIPQIVTLAKKMAGYHYKLDSRHYRTAAEYTKLEEYPKEWMEDKNSAMIVAEDDGAIKGYCVAAVEEARDFMTPAIKKIGVIHGMFVESPSRKKGIGRALVAKATEWLKKKGADHIELTVDTNNSESYAAWKKLGFVDYKIKMRLSR